MSDVCMNVLRYRMRGYRIRKEKKQFRLIYEREEETGSQNSAPFQPSLVLGR